MTVVVKVTRNDLEDSLVSAILRDGRFACDIETSGLDPQRDRIGTVQVYSPSAGAVVVQVGSAAPGRLCRLISDARIITVFHHAMFDLRFMARCWGVDPANIVCTKIASKLLNPQFENDRHSLNSLVQRYFQVALDKRQRLSDWLLPELSAEQIQYAAADVEHLLLLAQSLEADLREAGLYELYVRCLDFIPTRVLLDLGGWPDVFRY